MEIILIFVTTHQIAQNMAGLVKLKSGNYHIQIRRKGQYASKTFSRKVDTVSRSLEADRRTDQGTNIIALKVSGFTTFGQLIDLYIADMIEVNKPLGRSKEFALRMLKKNLGRTKLSRLKRATVLEYGLDLFRCSSGSMMSNVHQGPGIKTRQLHHPTSAL